MAWGLVIASCVVGGEKGNQMWNLNDECDDALLENTIKQFDANKFMSLKRFKEWKTCVTEPRR